MFYYIHFLPPTLFCYIYISYFCLFPGSLEFWCLVTVTFRFTVLYNNIYRKKNLIGKGEDYTTGSLLDFNYFDKHYELVAVDLSKQKELDADPRAIQQIDFKYMLGTNSTIYWILEKSKETILEFYKGTVKVY